MKSTGLDIDAKLRISAADASAGTRQNVRIMRFVRCTACQPSYRGAGCPACSDGLTTREENLSVRVPAEITSGTRLRLANKGHESTREPTGDLYLTVEFVSPQVGAKDATKATKLPPPSSPSAETHDARDAVVDTPHTHPLHAPWSWQHRRTKLVALLAAAVAVAGAAAFIVDRQSRGDLGVSCSKATDCRSNACLELWEEPEAIVFPPSMVSPTATSVRVGLPHRTGGVCSASCKHDGDCPGGMKCVPVSQSTHVEGLPDLGPGTPNALMCAR
jgi:hypothetical protein